MGDVVVAVVPLLFPDDLLFERLLLFTSTHDLRPPPIILSLSQKHTYMAICRCRIILANDRIIGSPALRILFVFFLKITIRIGFLLLLEVLISARQ